MPGAHDAADPAPPCRHLLLNLRLWSAAPPATQRQLQGLWAQLAAGEPLLVRSLLPPAQILHHVRAAFFSGGARMRELARRSAAEVAQQGQQRAATAILPAAASAQGLAERERAPAGQLVAAAGPAPSPAEAAELRRGYIRLAGTLIGQSAAAAARQGGSEAGSEAVGTPPGGAPESVLWRDEGLGADLQAALALLADCCTSLAASGTNRCSGGGGGGGSGASSSDAEGPSAGAASAAGDAALLQELLTALLLPLLRRDSLARLPLLACLQRAGGAALLLPLLRLEQQHLRLLGLRAITACLSPTEGEQEGWAATGHAGSSCSGGGSSRGPTQARSRSATPQGGGPRASLGSAGADCEEAEQGDTLAAAGRLLAAWPLTAATRIALLEMVCDGAPWAQVTAR